MKRVVRSDVMDLLMAKHDQYNCPEFIVNDPISIPHSFNRKEDIEISAFLTATLAWGNRRSIINNANRLMDLMDRAPHDFVLDWDGDPDRLGGFVHRTFNTADLAGFLDGLQAAYREFGGLEALFSEGYREGGIYQALAHFREVFVSGFTDYHTLRHVSDVAKGSAAKRLNLFLMWMVRSDRHGVHFGLWKDILPADLMIPLDTHVARVARLLGLLKRKTNDWKAVEELTAILRTMDPEDPCKFDFSLFGLGLFDHF
jgi:uncharacterized protein (TIGR02757 family)